MISDQACPLSKTWGKSCVMSSGSVIVKPRHHQPLQVPQGKQGILLQVPHVGRRSGTQCCCANVSGSCGSVLPLRLPAENSIRGPTGSGGGRGLREVCRLLSDTSIVNVRARVSTSSDYPERTCGSLLREGMPISSQTRSVLSGRLKL